MEYSSKQRYWVLEIKLSVYVIVSSKLFSYDAEKKVKEQMNVEMQLNHLKAAVFAQAALAPYFLISKSAALAFMENDIKNKKNVVPRINFEPM
ncbi:hypothetical protein GBA52_011164 [Prunus armeniaca]|nr:hypothetical protein GBA52_011164 [Prunus armeniaca]